jgi:hypothetical protein
MPSRISHPAQTTMTTWTRIWTTHMSPPRRCQRQLCQAVLPRWAHHGRPGLPPSTASSVSSSANAIANRIKGTRGDNWASVFTHPLHRVSCRGRRPATSPGQTKCRPTRDARVSAGLRTSFTYQAMRAMTAITGSKKVLIARCVPASLGVLSHGGEIYWYVSPFLLPNT